MPVVREGVRVFFEAGAARTATEAFEALRDGSPAIWTRAAGATLDLSVAFFRDGEEQIVADRLREVLAA